MDDALTIAGVKRLHDGGQGCWMKDLTTGKLFRALLNTHPEIEPGSELTYDPRMASMMEVLNERVPAELSAADTKVSRALQCVRNGSNWKLLTRVNSAVDCVMVFLILQVTPNDS